MAELNAVGDVVVTDPRAMRALASSERLALHDALRRHGPLTAEELAARLERSSGDVLEHLAALQDVALVERSETQGGDRPAEWVAIGKGIHFEIPEDPDGQDAARQLTSAMILQKADLPQRWVTQDEPQLSIAWARAAGMLHARVVVTTTELQDIQAGLETVLEPYLKRQADSAPAEARQVRILSYFMPEPGEEKAAAPET